MKLQILPEDEYHRMCEKFMALENDTDLGGMTVLDVKRVMATSLALWMNKVVATEAAAMSNTVALRDAVHVIEQLVLKCNDAEKLVELKPVINELRVYASLKECNCPICTGLRNVRKH